MTGLLKALAARLASLAPYAAERDVWLALELKITADHWVRKDEDAEMEDVEDEAQDAEEETEPGMEPAVAGLEAVQGRERGMAIGLCMPHL